MNQFESGRVNVEYRDQINAIRPVRGRKYTMTHSDNTGELFVTIGRKFAEDKIDDIRDEVLMTFMLRDKQLILYGEVLVDGEGVQGRSKFRYDIFTREMPLALKAIRYADRRLFQKYPNLDDIPIEIHFRSENPEYNKVHSYGTMKDYK